MHETSGLLIPLRWSRFTISTVRKTKFSCSLIVNATWGLFRPSRFVRDHEMAREWVHTINNNFPKHNNHTGRDSLPKSSSRRQPRKRGNGEVSDTVSVDWLMALADYGLSAKQKGNARATRLFARLLWHMTVPTILATQTPVESLYIDGVLVYLVPWNR